MMNIDSEWNQRKSQFFKLWPGYNTNKIEQIWSLLTRQYSEKTRFYHTREHILNCLHQFDLVEDKLISSDAIQMSIWFHDIIYIVTAKDNEEQSALFFSRIAEGILSAEFIKQVADLIVSTKHLNPPPNCDQAYLLDIDLSSFGTSLEEFYLNGNKLRQEVPHLSDVEYQSNQIVFFNRLLNRKQIFFTEYFHLKYEQIARRNIDHQMQELIKTN